MVSDATMDVILLDIGMALGFGLVGFFLWRFDKSREKGAFHFLGLNVAKAWAWDVGEALVKGDIEGLPVNHRELQKLASAQMAERKDAHAAKAQLQVLTEEADRLRAKNLELAEEIERLTTSET